MHCDFKRTTTCIIQYSSTIHNTMLNFYHITRHPSMLEITSSKCAINIKDNPFLYFTLTTISWLQMNNDVKADDVAVVIANALVHDECRTCVTFNLMVFILMIRDLDQKVKRLSRMHFPSIELSRRLNSTGCRVTYVDVRIKKKCSYAADLSNGLFLKALQHNKESALKQLPSLSPLAFGPYTWQEVKPDLKCDEGFLECEIVYSDKHKYVADSDEEECGY
jgi:hypothetical protein